MITMRAFLILTLFLFLINSISALCNEGQIDINTASLEELDLLYGIGPVKAQAIIDSRPFESVDNLIDVYGIGDVTLKNIITQGLACVGNEEDNEENKVDANLNSPSDEEELTEEIVATEKISAPAEPIVINLNPKVIKGEDNNEILDGNNDYAVYELIAFCILLIVLFLMRNRSYKTEFDK